ncbi:MAG: MerR family transcriptional regulator [Rhodococcus sp.]|uniref:MerR family transcriptional regulator n=1 Tax=Rhodococcus TaxID=1827 RepID=UPI001693A47C|nr:MULTISPECIES: MerR family transcriptional regulator [Rhodococcus]NLV80206.1 MerR family transcriptional regulator [Rhodococcus sp. (in: high G+C Gram-positive bacteria)]
MRSEWSIQELARAAGVTSRTLRHYGDVGVLEPSRTGANGMRFYDADALVRLQRILLLRDLGLGLPAIRQVLEGNRDTVVALRTHLDLLRHERELLDRRIEAVRTTIDRTRRGEALMAHEVFDGFDHTRYRDEVVERWGADAYDTGDRWWRGMTDAQRTDWQGRVAQLSREWADAARAGLDPAGPEAQDLARRHIEWLASVPGTPGYGTAEGSPREYVLGLADMYVADDRFAANYGGTEGAEFVRTVLRIHLR